jgi:hypothetical protein
MRARPGPTDRPTRHVCAHTHTHIQHKRTQNTLHRANAQRVRSLRRLPEFATAQPDPWHGLQPPLPVPGTTLRSHLRLLATHALLSDVELERVFLDLSNALHTPESLQALVAWLPEGGEDGEAAGGGGGGGGGGLLRLATALFHGNQQVCGSMFVNVCGSMCEHA